MFGIQKQRKPLTTGLLQRSLNALDSPYLLFFGDLKAKNPLQKINLALFHPDFADLSRTGLEPAKYLNKTPADFPFLELLFKNQGYKKIKPTQSPEFKLSYQDLVLKIKFKALDSNYLLILIKEISRKEEQKQETRIISRHFDLIKELHELVHKGKGIYSIAELACDSLKEIHGFKFTDFGLYQENINQPYFLYLYHNIQNNALSTIEKISGLNSKSLKVPLFKGSIFRKMYDQSSIIELSSEEEVVRAIADFVSPEKKVLRSLASEVAKIAGNKFIYLVPIIYKDSLLGHFGLNHYKALSKMEKELIFRLCSEIASIINTANLEFEKELIHQKNKKNEEKARILLSAVPEIILRLNKDNIIEDIHSSKPEERKILADFLNRSIQDICPPPYLKQGLKAISAARDSGERVVFSIQQDKIKGEKRYYEIHIVATAEQSVIIIQNITEKSKTLELLRKSNREKELLLSEVHHRIKNNLQLISSVLNLQVKSITDKQSLEIFNSAISRIFSMSRLHELFYQSADFRSINIKNYLERLIELMESTYGEARISICHECDDIFLDMNQVFPLGLIIQEVLSNTYKYAFPHSKSGKIIINLKQNQKINLLIKDNGKGFVVKKSDQHGLPESQNLGILLISSLAQQIKADFFYKQNQGTEFHLNFFPKKTSDIS